MTVEQDSAKHEMDTAISRAVRERVADDTLQGLITTYLVDARKETPREERTSHLIDLIQEALSGKNAQ